MLLIPTSAFSHGTGDTTNQSSGIDSTAVSILVLSDTENIDSVITQAAFTEEKEFTLLEVTVKVIIWHLIPGTCSGSS